MLWNWKKFSKKQFFEKNNERAEVGNRHIKKLEASTVFLISKFSFWHDVFADLTCCQTHAGLNEHPVYVKPWLEIARAFKSLEWKFVGKPFRQHRFLWHFGIENTEIGDDLVLPSCPPSFLHMLYVNVDRGRLSHLLRFQTRVLSEVFKNAIPVQRTAYLNYTLRWNFWKESVCSTPVLTCFCGENLPK